MLPFEVLTLTLLVTCASALPQGPKSPNTNDSPPQPTIPLIAHTEISEGGFNIPSASTEIHRTPNIVRPSEIPETGFEDPPSSTFPQASRSFEAPHTEKTVLGFEGLSSSIAVGNPFIVHTEIPVPGFETPSDPKQTEFRPQAATSPNAPEPPGSEETPQPANPPAPQQQSLSGNGGGNNNPSAPAANPTGPAPAPPQPTSGNDLLNQIASHIFAQPGAQPSNQPPSPTGGSPAPNGVQPTAGGFDTPGQSENTRPQPTSRVQVASPGAQVTGAEAQATASGLIMNEPITLGPSATLTLTPGLSTTIGTGLQTTFVQITTNSDGQTIILIGSAGSTISSTVTSAPKTASSVKTGVEARTTSSENRSPTSAGGAAATTSKKGGAALRWRWENGPWLVVIVGVFGSVALL